MDNRPILRFLCAVHLAAIMLLASGCGGGAVPAPTSFQTWNAKDGTFSIEYPADWEADGGGQRGVQWAEFQNGNAVAKVDVGTADSIIADIIDTGASPLGEGFGEVDEELSAAAQIHDMRKEELGKSMSNYAEQPAEILNTALGEGRRGEFTATGGLGAKYHGYHATVLSRDRRITVICQCSESNWETLQPAFRRMIDSLAYGNTN